MAGPDWYARDALHFNNLPTVVREAKAAALVVACWGAGACDPHWTDHVLEEIQFGEAPWPDVHCFSLSKDGSPIHPMARGRSRIPITRSRCFGRPARRRRCHDHAQRLAAHRVNQNAAADRGRLSLITH